MIVYWGNVRTSSSINVDWPVIASTGFGTKGISLLSTGGHWIPGHWSMKKSDIERLLSLWVGIWLSRNLTEDGNGAVVIDSIVDVSPSSNNRKYFLLSYPRRCQTIVRRWSEVCCWWGSAIGRKWYYIYEYGKALARRNFTAQEVGK